MFLQKMFPDKIRIVSGNDKSIMDAVSEADIYFHESPGGDLANIIPDFIREHFPRVKIVFDYDDAPWSMIPPYHPSYIDYGTEECAVNYGSLIGRRGEKIEFKREWKRGGVVEGHVFNPDINVKHIMDANLLREKTDYITTTTPYLADMIKKQVDKPVTILPNFIEPSLYGQVKDPNKKPGEVRIGWIAGHSHLGDILDLLPAIIDLLNERKNVKFYMISQYNDMLVNIVKNCNIPADRFIVFPAVGIMNGYFNVLSNLDLDIGIMHLKENDVYNKCKSPLKFLEMTAIGAACLAPDILYGDYVQNETTGLIYANRNEWNILVRRLIDNAQMRKDLNSAAKCAIGRFCAADVVPEYLKFFESIMVTK
jgi:glycosyltransferase involved in cell wall biosynthesis